MNKVHDSLTGNTVETGAIGVDGWSNGTIDVSAHTLKGSALAELTVAQTRELIQQLEAAIAAVEAQQ